MDIRRGGSPVVSARPAAASKLHQRAQAAPARRSLDLRGPAKPTSSAPARTRGSVKVPHAGFTAPPASVDTAAVLVLPEAPATPPLKTRTHKHEFARFEDRFERAKSVPKSQHVTRFGPTVSPAGIVAAPAEPPRQPLIAPIATPTALPPAVLTAHTALSKLPPSTEDEAPTTLQLAPKWVQYAGVTAAVAIMGGYIWLQNFPKLTVQAAAARAGVAATTPSYLPTSYNLTGTTAAPGLLTLNFTSPSQPQALTIAQKRTSWDAKSLLDNYVATADPTYSAVNGQGLTIYLFNNNQAAWVNHGIWYTIKGTARLSRDQVLKIAYGL